jgi:hypothetical protein
VPHHHSIFRWQVGIAHGGKDLMQVHMLSSDQFRRPPRLNSPRGIVASATAKPDHAAKRSRPLVTEAVDSLLSLPLDVA